MFQNLYAVIKCPKDLCELNSFEDSLYSQCGIKYIKIKNKPILIESPREVSVTTPDQSQISKNVEKFTVPDFIENLNPRRILHFGSGDVLCDDPRVLSTDLLPNDNVDVVCEGERLPFSDETFDYISSGAVLEHVANPLKVAEELNRVLKVGGILQSTVAFNQPYHGFPSHYFNWSPVAMESYLVGANRLLKSDVAQDGTLAVNLTQSWDIYLENLPFYEREKILKMPLNEALSRFRDDRSLTNPNVAFLNKFVADQLCSAYEVVSQKVQHHSQIPIQLIQEFYETRRIVILRIHEINFYSMKLGEKSGSFDSQVNYSLPSVDGFKTIEEVRISIDRLKNDEIILRMKRDEVIQNWLSR